jgi:hypothetical protein
VSCRTRECRKNVTVTHALGVLPNGVDPNAVLGFTFRGLLTMNQDDALDCDWHPGSETPDDDMQVAFDLIHDTVRRDGRFRNSLSVESAVAARLWAPRAIARWVYLESDGELKRKSVTEAMQKSMK